MLFSKFMSATGNNRTQNAPNITKGSKAGSAEEIVGVYTSEDTSGICDPDLSQAQPTCMYTSLAFIASDLIFLSNTCFVTCRYAGSIL